MTEHWCPKCGNGFNTRQGLAVHHWRSHGELLPNRTCANCETEFRSKYEVKYCSDSCREASVSFEGANNPNYGGKRSVGTCTLCDQEFEFYSSEKRGLYCPTCVRTEPWQDPPRAEGSDNPWWTGGKETSSCAVCASQIERWPSEITETNVCTEECRRKWLSDAFSGENHPNWQDGGNIEYGTGWNPVRKSALERDDYSCRLCHKTRDELGRNPDVHHIVPVRWFVESDRHEVEDAHTIDNVISLCPSCHRKAEFGRIPPRDLCRKIEVDPDELPN